MAIAALAAAATLGAAAIASKSSSNAAKSQSASAKNALQLQKAQWIKAQEDAQPWLDVGQKAVGAQEFEMGLGERPAGYQGFQATPGYEFRVGEGQKAIERSAAARGELNSGRTLKALNAFGQGIAADEYGTFSNRLAALAGTGQTQANNLAGLGANYAGTGSNTLMQAGNNQASAYANQGNIWGNAIGQIGGAAGNYLGQQSAGGSSNYLQPPSYAQYGNISPTGMTSGIY